MYRTLILVSFVLTSMTQADDTWVSLPVTPEAAPVVSAGSDSTDVSQVGGGSSLSSSDLVAELLMQLEQMQQELSLLRNLVEKNSQSIEDSTVTDQQRYLEVDRRLSTLTKTLLLGQSSSDNLSIDKASSVNDASVIVSSSKTVAGDSGQSAEVVYQKAMGLLRDKDFESAKLLFQQFRQEFVDHPLVANALYWQAEVLLIDKELDEAASLFKQVITQFPQHGKAPDAAYKLGVTLHRQGKTDDAKAQLRQVIDQYSDLAKSTAKLAEGYLQRL